MAQVRKLEQAGNIPEKKVSGNINFNGTSSEFSDELYDSLIKKLDTSAAAGMIRKGLDLGKQSGNTFHYDSGYNRAYVTNSNGEKIWDYQASVGRRSNFKVKWQGTFGRENLHKNPNDVNRLLQSVMSSFSIPDDPESDATGKTKPFTDDITIQLSENKSASLYDPNYTAALDRLTLLSTYYGSPDSFLEEYEFEEDDPIRKYLDHHKNTLSDPEYFQGLMTRVRGGTYNNDDEQLLNALKIYLKTKSPTDNSGTSNQGGTGNGGTGNGGTGNGGGGTAGNQGGSGAAGSVNFANGSYPYYLADFYELSTYQEYVNNPEYHWKTVRSFYDPQKKLHWAELTNLSDQVYYAIKNENNNYYKVSVNDKTSILIPQSGISAVTTALNTSLPTSWLNDVLFEGSGNLARLQKDGAPDVIYAGNGRTKDGKNVPLRRSMDGKRFFAAGNHKGKAVWIEITRDQYMALKNGTLLALPSAENGIEMFNKGGKILKMQNAATGKVPGEVAEEGDYLTYTIWDDEKGEFVRVKGKAADANADIVIPINQEKPTNTYGPFASTIMTMAPLLTAPISSNPIVRRWSNGIATAGFAGQAAFNLYDAYKSGQWDPTHLYMSLYGLGRSFVPSSRQIVYANKKPVGNPSTVKVKRNAEFSVQEGTPSINRSWVTVNGNRTELVPVLTAVSGQKPFRAKFVSKNGNTIQAALTSETGVQSMFAPKFNPYNANRYSSSDWTIFPFKINYELPVGSKINIPAHQTVPNFGHRAYGLGQGLGWGLRTADWVTRATGLINSVPAIRNFVTNIANDPNKSFFDPETWSRGDLQNFQIGVTGFNVMGNALYDYGTRRTLAKALPNRDYNFMSYNYMNYANKPENIASLQTKVGDFRYNNPGIDIFRNPYTIALNTAAWNNPATTRWFSTNPSALGLTGGFVNNEVAPLDIKINYDLPLSNRGSGTGTVQPIDSTIFVPANTSVPVDTTSAPRGPVNNVPQHTIKLIGFKKGGIILKMQTANQGVVPELIEGVNGILKIGNNYVVDPTIYQSFGAARLAIRKLLNGKHAYFHYGSQGWHPTYSEGETGSHTPGTNEYYEWMKGQLGSVPGETTYAAEFAKIKTAGPVADDTNSVDLSTITTLEALEAVKNQITPEEYEAAKVRIQGATGNEGDAGNAGGGAQPIDLNTITTVEQLDAIKDKISQEEYNAVLARINASADGNDGNDGNDGKTTIDLSTYKTVADLDSALQAGTIDQNQYNQRKAELDYEKMSYLAGLRRKQLKSELNLGHITQDEFDAALMMRRAGAWSKATQVSGSLTMPILEGAKVGQSISTTKKNFELTKDAIKREAQLKQIPASAPPILRGYDFSHDNILFGKTIAQLNSQLNNVGKSTSDNSQVLASNNMYNAKLSELTDKLSAKMSTGVSETNKFNTAGMAEWNKAEMARVYNNNAVTGAAEKAIAEHETAKNTQLSRDINASLDTLQKWIQHDKMNMTDLQGLYSRRDLLRQQLTINPTDPTLNSEWTKVNEEIARLRPYTNMLPHLRQI